MADIQKRGNYTPRRVRQQRAYRLAVAGGVTGTVGVVALVLAIVGAGTGGLAAVALIIAAICVVMFRRTAGV
jgi:membrane-bound ClpP family serine protease